MERRTRFLIAFVVAALTFGSLRAFVGPPHWQRSGHQCHTYYGERHHHSNGHHHTESSENSHSENADKGNNGY